MEESEDEKKKGSTLYSEGKISASSDTLTRRRTSPDHLKHWSSHVLNKDSANSKSIGTLEKKVRFTNAAQ
jgi:hypothetical protein